MNDIINIANVSQTFETTKEELQKTVAPLQGLSIVTIEDRDRMYEACLRLAKIRNNIKATGKKGRDLSNAYNKAILTLEKSLLGEVVPLEDKYRAEIDAFDNSIKLESQKIKLVDRKAALVRYDIPVVPDEEILTLDDDQFSKFVIDKLLELRKAKEEAEKVVQMKKDVLAEAEANEKAELDKVAKKKRYQDWLDANAFDTATHILTPTNGGKEITLWKRVAIYTI